MVTAIGYAYPWDFDGDPAAAARAVDLGVDGIAVAAAYHTTRAATPMHPTRRTVTARHAAFYLPIRPAVWRGSPLVPAAPTWPGSFTAASSAVRARGLAVHAWTVLTHNSQLGSRHGDLVVRNAYGEPYTYGLCPSHEVVRDYCATLVSEVVELGEPDGVVLEACGPLGIDHAGHHDKVEFADWTSVQRALLSLCFCTGCLPRYRSAGVDPEELRARVRRLPSAASVSDALGGLAAPVAEVRTTLAAELRDRLVGILRSARVRATVHASADPFASGAFATVAGHGAALPDTVVANCWWPDAEPALAALRTATRPDIGLGGYFRPDTLPVEPMQLSDLVRRYLAAGMDELHLYHLGLVSGPQSHRLADLAAVARRSTSPTRRAATPYLGTGSGSHLQPHADRC
ncbi:hypothetical protein [Micromonospora mirobrigensis]|uniref:Alanine-rich protein n=1 Tax=Micromonospora mirobrigensis TaxID=262898 RepID=A0A1C5AKM0_9ACTN|nr:hypothetical protein [Micromonospora mirobrigensis]SCF45749.1 hypothetical protein GA0070564_11219 [Micromonospora mirobrigensis]